MPDFQVRDARGAALVDGCALLARALEFSDRDALPPWLVQTSASSGGLALGAFVDERVVALPGSSAGERDNPALAGIGERLVGFSFAMPGARGELFSCGLAVDPAYRGHGVARRLKLAQRERALALGATAIRWTADPLAAPALALYLGGLRARLVAYAPELYAAVRPAAADDVMIEWPLPGPASEPPRPAARVEIPLDPSRLATAELAHWRLGVRRAMTDALAAGAIGTDVAVDRAGGRAWVLFSEAA